MKRLNAALLSVMVVVASCQKSDVTSAPDQPEKSKMAGGGFGFTLSISPVNEVNTTCSDLSLNVKVDKTSKGTIVLNEYTDAYRQTVINKWTVTNTDNTVINTGTSAATQRYFDATFTWGSKIVTGAATVQQSPCQ